MNILVIQHYFFHIQIGNILIFSKYKINSIYQFKELLFHITGNNFKGMNRLFAIQHSKGLIRQNSDANLDKDSIRLKEMRQMREMKSVNKQLGNKKKHFFFQEGQKTVGDYKFDVKKQIGSGYSSKVYKAIHTKTNGEYAIKAIQFKNFKPSHFQMLQNEIKILKKLSHPNVLRFESVSKTSTHLYIITEFCEKGDLLTYMTRKGLLQEKEALDIFADILKGIQYLQRMGIIHRDIKPGNILNDGTNWKIADFGFSIQSIDQIRTRNNVGTPLYMPLESLQKNLYSPQSDIFSVGVVLYQLLVGITPWECRDQQQLIKKLKSIDFKIPQKIKISQQIKQLLKKLCQPLRQNRMPKIQFMLLDPLTFKNFETSINIFKRQIIEEPPKIQIKVQSKQDIIPSLIKRKISIKNFNSSQIKLNQQLKERNHQKPKNQLNLFANGKMKKSSQNLKNEDQPSIKSLTKIRSVQNLFESTLQQNRMNQQSPQGKSKIYFKDKTQKLNRNILLALLNFCRFMYYLVKNAQNLQLNEGNRQKIKLILLKHSICLLKQLVDSQNNWFGLQNYQNYKETKNYFRIYSSFQQYLTKYQKQCEQMIKKIDGAIIKQVYQKIQEFSNDQNISINQGFYQKLLTFVGPILRQNNHNLASQIINSKKKLTDEIKFKIQGIKHFFKYYRLVEMFSKQNFSIEYFQQNNGIEVIKSYTETNVTVQEFMNLRKEMKYI